VELRVGAAEEDVFRFRPVSAFAEYVELPGLGNELRVTLAGYHASCEEFVPPEAGQASVSVVVVTPPGDAPAATTYTWTGHSLHGGTPARPERAYAVPSARVGKASYVFSPGGSVQIDQLRLVPQGEVSGVMNFEFPGDANTAASSVKGAFRADICRFDRAPSREKPGFTLK
jgi:hypothetical protein